MQIEHGAIRLQATQQNDLAQAAFDQNVANQCYDMAALLFGGLHDLLRTAVYDPSSNSDYMESLCESDGEFPARRWDGEYCVPEDMSNES